MSVPLVFMPGALLVHLRPRGCSLTAWVWSQGSWYYWVPDDCSKRRDSSWMSHPRRVPHREWLEHPPTPVQTFCEGDFFAYPGTSAKGANFRFAVDLESTVLISGHKLWGYNVSTMSMGVERGDTIFGPSLYHCIFLLSPRRKLIHSTRAPTFATFTSGYV